jgi:hypothetical protein
MNTKVNIKTLNTPKLVSSAEISSIQQELNWVFPKEYIDFLKIYNGTEFESNIFYVKSYRGFCSLSEIINILDLRTTYKDIIRNFESEYIPIALAEGGNYILLSRNLEIYFLDHEDEKKYKIANNLSGFLKLLKPNDISRVTLNPDDIISIYVDPKLKDL